MNGWLPEVLSRAFRWTKVDQFYGLEIEERGFLSGRSYGHGMETVWFCVAVGALDRFERAATHELSVIRSAVAAVGNPVSAVAFPGEFSVPAETYVEFLSCGNKERLNDYRSFNLRWLEQCLRKLWSSNFASVDPFSTTKFIVTRLKTQNTVIG